MTDLKCIDHSSIPSVGQKPSRQYTFVEGWHLFAAPYQDEYKGLLFYILF